MDTHNEYSVGIRLIQQIGLGMGIPWVGISHTVPVPTNTIPIMTQVQYLWVTGMVFMVIHGDTIGSAGYPLNIHWVYLLVRLTVHPILSSDTVG